MLPVTLRIRKLFWTNASFLSEADALDRKNIMTDWKKLRFFMDETSVPYEENENPFPRAKEDDVLDEMIIEKYHLITKEMETIENKKSEKGLSH